MGTTSQKNIAFKIDRDILDSAKEVFKSNGLSTKKAITLFLKRTVLTGKVDLPSESSLDNELLFLKLSQEVQEAVSEAKADHYLTEEDVLVRYGL